MRASAVQIARGNFRRTANCVDQCANSSRQSAGVFQLLEDSLDLTTERVRTLPDRFQQPARERPTIRRGPGCDRPSYVLQS
jgi:hypothetical protein